MLIKKRFKNGFIALLLAMGVIAQANADGDNSGIEVIGSQTHRLPIITKANKANQDTRTIQLLKIKLSEEERNKLKKQAKQAQEHTGQFAPALALSQASHSVHLKMNNVPVLDQGRHGTCGTFAMTAALDAVLGKGDYISQLCNLQLGSYLEKHSYFVYSGWDGTTSRAIIDQITQYGIVNKKNQLQKGCGGMTEYPAYQERDTDSFIDPEQYQAMSEKVFGKTVNWHNIYWEISSSWTLSEVKSALDAGDRTVFSVLLPRVDLGLVGAVGKYKAAKDAWVLTKEIADDAYWTDAAHAMVITGYDDEAVAIDPTGVKHKGLLSLRNSWGKNYGDEGDFYMSYDYFKLLTFDARRISPY